MKRKYTRKDALRLKSSPIKQDLSSKLPPPSLTPDVLEVIDKVVARRKALGLPDDREEIVERAIRYQEFINENKPRI